MKIENIVTSLETSNKLNIIGFKEKSIFSYHKNQDGDLIVAETNLTNENLEFVVYCYTFSELLNYLPHELEVNHNVYIPIGNKFQKIEKDKFLYGKKHALLDFIKADQDNFVMRYAFEGKMIAFRQNTEGLFCNLLVYDNTEADCVAKMLMLLVEEEKLNYNLELQNT